MPASAPFIVSYQLEDFAPGGLPFVVGELSAHTAAGHAHLMGIHRHSYYMLALCTEGQTTDILDFEPMTVKAGEMVLIVPGQVHEPRRDYTGKGFIIAFSADFLLHQEVSLPTLPSGPVRLSDADFAQACLIITQLQREYTEQTPQYVAMLQHYLSLLITLLYRHASAYMQSGPPLLQRYRSLLSAHFLEWTKPAQYAAALHVSVDHLNEVVKLHTGQTVSSHLNERRVLEAKRLLLHAKESIKEIAWHLQFNEVSYFNRFFKQHTGHTPAAFREKVREKYLSDPE